MSNEMNDTELLWVVAHTRPRAEKKLADWCRQQGFDVTLPLYKSVKKYPGKSAVFEKPLFPNYLFLKLARPQNRLVYQSDHVAKAELTAGQLAAAQAQQQQQAEG